MAQVDFFTAVSFGNQPKSCTEFLLETVDDYFYLGGTKACVVSNATKNGFKGTILQQGDPAFLVTALKVISYLTIAIPLILLSAKAILRSMHSFHLITSEEEFRQWNPVSQAQEALEEGVNLSRPILQKIQELLPTIQASQDNEQIIWHSRRNDLVFRLNEHPQLIFTMATQDATRQAVVLSPAEKLRKRFANMVKAKEVCLTHPLNLLIVQPTKIFQLADGKKLKKFMAQEHLNINQNPSAQEEFFKLPNLNNALRELTIFIAQTGIRNVGYGNIHVIDTEPEFQEDRRVALTDLEEMKRTDAERMEGAKIGIFGDSCGRRGLIGCLQSEEQIDIVLDEAARQGIHNSSLAQIKAKRLREIQTDQQLENFHKERGIVGNPRQPLRVDIETLGLQLDEKVETYLVPENHTIDSNPETSVAQQRPITLRDAVVDVIHKINDALTQTPENASTKGKRFIVLNVYDQEMLGEYNRWGITSPLYLATEEELKRTWLRQILAALVDQKHLFNFDKIENIGYSIQA